LREKNNWIGESYRTGKMQTFLDVYLFDVARRQGKWTGGVEDLKDQEDIVDLVDESDIEELAAEEDETDTKREYNLSMNLFIKAYVNNDLNAIERLSYSNDSLYEDALLIKRNKKMAMRMDSLGHIRSMVFAVGAAHLPGDKGLIALLKEKGFTVEPVFASKKIKAKDYKVADISLPWQDVKDDAGFYTATMPGKPGDLTLYDLITMKMYFDVFGSTIYMTAALKTPYSAHMTDSVFNVVSSYYFGDGSYAKGKQVTINGVHGKELFSAKDNYSHGYLLSNDGILYMVIGMSMKADTSAAKSINRFIHSFTILQRTPGDNSNAFTYINTSKAFQVDVPTQPKPAGDMMDASTDSTTNREINIVTDPVSGAYLLFGTNEAAKGYDIINDSSLFSSIKESQKEKFLQLSTDTMYLKDGHLCLDFAGMLAQAPLMMRTHYESRGNRWYVQVALYDTAKPNSSTEQFFNSFKLLDYTASGWNNYTSADNVFSTWAPLNITLEKKPAYGDTTYSYETYDTSRADSYGVAAYKFSKYYWQNSDSALWDKMIDESVQYSDSLLSKKPVRNGEANGYEILMQQQGSQNIKRIRMLLNGNKIYKLYTVQAAAEINNANNNKYFDDFRFNAIEPHNNLLVSKAAVVLNDISSADSVTRTRALAHLSISPFTKNELPLLHAALLKTYTEEEDDDDDDKTKLVLKNIIIKLKDTSSYSFAKNNYATADDETKNILLVIMASFPTKENFNEIKNIVLNQPPHTAPGYSLINLFSDSLSLTAGIFPDLLPLMKDTVMASFTINITNKLIDSGLIDKTLLQPYQENILQLSEKNYKALQRDPDNYDALNSELVDLLGKINTSAGNAMLGKWSSVNDLYLKMNAVLWLLRNKQTINVSAIQSLAKDKLTRTELYDSLKAYKKQNLFPSQYLTQKSFAESYVYIVGSDDDDPTDLTFLTQKVINFKGRQSRFFFYKITYGEGDDANYSLACAGPFHTDVKDVSSEDATGDLYYDENFDPANLSAQMDTLIKQMEDWYKWADEKKKE
jgi:hypothetical protein